MAASPRDAGSGTVSAVIDAYDFDRFLRYDELIAWLRRARRRPPRPRRRRVVRAQPRGPRPPARDRHRLLDRRARHQAGALGRRQHPRRRADGDGRRVLPPPPPRRRPRRRRPGRHRGAAHPHVLRRPARQPRRRRVGARRPPRGSAGRARARGRGPTPTAGRASTSRTSTATAGSCRCASPTPTGRGSPHPDDAASAGARAARRRPAGATRYRLLARGRRRRPRRVHRPDPPPARRARPQPQLPGRLGHRRARVGRPSAVRAGDRRPGAGDRRPAQHLRVQRVPHQRRRDPAAVVDAARRRRCRRSTSGPGTSSASVGTRLTGYPVHSVFEDFTWDRAEHDERRRRRLGLRAPRRVRVDHRVLGRRPRRHRHQAERPTSGTPDRPTPRRSPCCAGSTSTPPSEHVDWYPFDHPQLGRRRARRLARPGRVDQPAARPAHGRGRAPRRVRRRPGAGRAVPGDPPRRRRRRWATATWRVEVGVANTGWLPTYVSARAPKEQLVLPLVAEFGGDGVAVVDGPARRQLGQLEGRAAMRFTQRQRRHARPRCWCHGSSRRRRVRTWTSSPAIRGPGPQSTLRLES